MPNEVLTALTPELLEKIPTMIRIADRLKTTITENRANATITARRINAIKAAAKPLQFPMNDELAALLVQDNPITNEEVQTLLARSLGNQQNGNQANPSMASKVLVFLMIGICFYKLPYGISFNITDNFIDATNKLSPSAKNTLKSILYPGMLYLEPQTAINMFSNFGIKTALKNLNLQLTKPQMMLTMMAVNALLGDYAPSKLIENWYRATLENLGPTLYVPISVGTLLFQYHDAFIKTRFFKTCEAFFDEMNGAPEEARATPISP